MWSTLATLTSYCKAVPPFQLTAMAFTVATGIGLVWMKYQRQSLASLRRLPLSAWLLGVFGLFGFHFFYFMALKHAPVVHASLISYLWPLLIVLLSALLPGERLRWYHLAGTMSGLLGASLIVTGGSSFSLASAHFLGYGFALLCAITWSGYSVLSRLFQAVPSYAISGFCALTALLAFICHLLFEQTVWPSGFSWLAVLGLGLGPVGGAFFTWDVGVKTGNIKVLGALSYAAPLLSTFLLLALGMADPTWALGVACMLIVGGSLLASGDMLTGYNKQRKTIRSFKSDC
jgi:drug/metabolite transporter (DMT)-like permease